VPGVAEGTQAAARARMRVMMTLAFILGKR